MSDDIWQVFALKYAERNARTRANSFIFDDDHASPHDMDYFIWVARNSKRTILIDTGYDTEEANRRGRPVLRHPVEALKVLGIRPEDIDTIIITHLHYDHAGGLDEFPNAVFHLQSAEMAFATGPCMCHGTLRMPYTAQHVCQMIHHVYSGRVIFHDGEGIVAPGITLHHIGGHSRGLQSVQIKTASGHLCLASDASHYYENFISQKPFPIVDSIADMHNGWQTIQSLASHRDLVIPGHDPLVTRHFPALDNTDFGWRLDVGPHKPIEI
ncbi:N-acyl homoserine lactonase family protein [Hoeflea prorocentri]|uniref:N-acyl homoserine lactonase family protein n=1 Tax=Hoeflea prorocentri TaxID=1922333 RepID=A0A9X3UH00_9HYPH|nr:N-acyl homoserine lactonase family protein [Hoeflea prorocentri]MCY6381152.1 N-acyl homoserine lactonase family protein [Hoeflea prorocentri]MDA5398952.1 N-acyl homoserine lactonase family protein [Hoeflea prorocentri]